MRAEKLDHIGIKVARIDHSLPEYLALGFRLTERRRFPEAGVEIAFVELGGQRFELIESLGDHSPIQADPEGLHHVALLCRDVVAAFDELRSDARYSVLGPPLTGSHGRTVMFFRTPGSSALLELVGATPLGVPEEPELWRW